MVTCLYLMPTGECNCICSYCYCPEGGKRGDPDLFRGVVESFTDHIISSNPPVKPQIRFTGGEPWLEKQLLPDIAGLFLRSVPDGLVVVNTNGMLLSADRLGDFRGDERLIHVVSLDGPETLHDSRRKTTDGRGTFHKVIEGVKMLMDLDLPVYLNAVLDTESSRHLPELLRFISSELGLVELSISLLHLDTGQLSPGERYSLLAYAYSEASSRSIRLGGHHRLLLGYWVPELRCNAGSATALVDSMGMVHACQRFVGRSAPDCMWTDDFDWNGFSSGQQCAMVCGSDHDHAVGKKLYNLYREEYPEYLHSHHLDRILFGVLA
ncbi:MAG: radical SAM protein [Candidatus Aegiribacteria sp.]|nr:radical SAM protein [Candidatus Aegiribacteria sp.]